jgi:hypothetical protein
MNSQNSDKMETRTQHPIYQLQNTQELNLGAKSPETVAQQAPKKAHFVCKKKQKGRCCRRGANCEFMFWGTSYGTSSEFRSHLMLIVK